MFKVEGSRNPLVSGRSFQDPLWLTTSQERSCRNPLVSGRSFQVHSSLRMPPVLFVVIPSCRGGPFKQEHRDLISHSFLES